MSRDWAELTESELRRLYVDECLHETEIAELFGTYQVRVNRLRRKFGIPTQARTDNLKLPDTLSSRLRSILIGSMLGDGGIRRTGELTACFVEHHSEKQKDYLDWKAREWGPFVSKVSPSNKDQYLGFRLRTHGCRVLSSYWQMFYPSGKGDKVFSNLDLSLVDPLAMAIWFMDDGSRTTSSIRFSVSPDPVNYKFQLRVLREFGLSPVLYPDPGDLSIHIKGRGSLTRFVDLISPHMPSCMVSKLELKVVRRAGPAPRDILTQDKVMALLDRGHSLQRIAEILDVSRGSVSRALDRFGISHRPVGRPLQGGPSDFTVEESTSLIAGINKDNPEYVDEVVRVLGRTHIPLPISTQEAVAHDVSLLKKCPTILSGTSFKYISKAGSLACTKNFPHRWEAYYRNNLAPKQAWYDERLLRQAVRFQIRVGDPVTPVRVFRAIQAVVRAPTNFRPSLAKAIVEVYSPQGGSVLDPCAGYGGRAAGSLASGRDYFGVDPHPKAKESFSRLQLAFGGSLTFFNMPFEEFDEKPLGVDLVFTSPPYFSVERYSDDATQSWVRYKTWDSWVHSFLEPLALKSFYHLKPGGAFCVNTKNIRIGLSTFPIVDELTRISITTGFMLESTLSIPIGIIGKDLRSEPLLVFRKSTA
jgi:hypothetical protein